MKATVLAQVLLRLVALSLIASYLLQVFFFLFGPIFSPSWEMSHQVTQLRWNALGYLLVPLLGGGLLLYFLTPCLARIVVWKIKE
jgi:hypothetical protein